jgi:hypothetical protein
LPIPAVKSNNSIKIKTTQKDFKKDKLNYKHFSAKATSGPLLEKVRVPSEKRSP